MPAGNRIDASIDTSSKDAGRYRDVYRPVDIEVCTKWHGWRFSVDPGMQCYRHDPRFAGLMNHLNLIDYWGRPPDSFSMTFCRCGEFKTADIVAPLEGDHTLRVFILFLIVYCSGLAAADDNWQRAVALYEQGAMEEAQASFENLQSVDPSNAEAHYYLGLIHQSRGGFFEAAEFFDKAVELDEKQSKYHQGLGEAYGSAAQNVSFFKQMRLAGKIKKAFERAVELDADNIAARSGLITYYLNAPGIVGGSEEKAEHEAKEIGKRDVYRGHLAMARIYQSREDDQAVEAEYQAAIKDSPEEMDTYLALGIFLTGKERFEDAIKIYDSALQKQPDAMGITYQVGRTASIAGKYLEQGETAFTRYLKYTPEPDEPGLDWANYRLGLIYQHQGKKELAKHQYQQALALNKKHPEAKKALNKISR